MYLNLTIFKWINSDNNVRNNEMRERLETWKDEETFVFSHFIVLAIWKQSYSNNVLIIMNHNHMLYANWIELVAII